MRKLTESAIDLADVCLFVIDARAGVTALDHFFADLLRKKLSILSWLQISLRVEPPHPWVFLIAIVLARANHCASSAEHGEGMTDLLSELVPLYDKPFQEGAHVTPEVDIDVSDNNHDKDIFTYNLPTRERPLQVAVIGRPNLASQH